MKNIKYILLFTILLGCNLAKDKEGKDEKQNLITIKSEINSIDTAFVFDLFYGFLKTKQNDSLKTIINKYGTNFRDFEGKSFYKLCLSYHNNSCIHFLLDNGYKVKEEEIYETVRTFHGDTILVNKILLSDRKINLDKIFRIAIYNCDIPLLENLFKQNIKPKYIRYEDMSGENQRLPTICFINRCSEKIEMLNLLLDNGFKINKENYECLLLNSVDAGVPRFGNKEFLSELINKGFLREDNEWSPLNSTVFWKKYETVKFLLENGYSPNWNNSSNLLFSAYSSPGDGFGEHISEKMKLKTVEILLQFGANPLLKGKNSDHDANEKTFYQFAKETKNDRLLKLLKKYAR